MTKRSGKGPTSSARHAPRLVFLAFGVLVAHIAALDWFASELDHNSILKAAARPMFTRVLQPQEPPQPPKVTAAPTASRPPPAPPEGAMAARLPEPTPAASAPEAVTQTVAVNDAAAPHPLAPPPNRSVPVAPAFPAVAAPSAPAEPASGPETSAARVEPALLDTWPVDTRLSYRLSGMYRGELYGNARVQWQRDKNQYQVRLDIDITLFGTMIMTSQGEVTDDGLSPRAYEEERAGKRRGARFGDRAIQLENGRSAQRPAGVQDTASQFVELAHRFATGQEKLEVGHSISLWLARPGAVDLWTYDIVERVTLDTPQLGKVDAFHLKPRPIANPRGNVTAEMWFAPSLQYLPVRIKVNMGEQAFVDLLVDRIEQR